MKSEKEIPHQQNISGKKPNHQPTECTSRRRPYRGSVEARFDYFTGKSLRNNGLFDYEETRKKIGKFTFKEARRLKLGICEALILELCEEGYECTAVHLRNLVNEENKIPRQLLIESICNNKNWLIDLVEIAKEAESLLKDKSDKRNQLLALRKYYEILVNLEGKAPKHNWALTYMYDVIICKQNHIFGNDENLNEIRTRISYKYGLSLINQHECQKSLRVLNMAFSLCKLDKWSPDTKPESYLFTTLHQAIAYVLAKVYLNMAKNLANADIKYSIELSHKAIVALSEAGRKNNTYLVCCAYVDKINFLLKSGNIELALEEIQKVKPLLRVEKGSVFIRLKCVLKKHEAICIYESNLILKAHKKLLNCLRLCRANNFTDIESELLLYIGRAYSKAENAKMQASKVLLEAKQIFSKQGDYKEVTKTVYLLAKIQSDQIFPLILQLIRSKNKCHLHDLRSWKNMCKPFWVNRFAHLLPLDHLSKVEKPQISSTNKMSSEESSEMIEVLSLEELLFKERLEDSSHFLPELSNEYECLLNPKIKTPKRHITIESIDNAIISSIKDTSDYFVDTFVDDKMRVKTKHEK